MLSGQPPKSRFDSSLISQRRDTQHAIKVPFGSDLVEAFVDCVEEVEGYDEDEDPATVFVEARCAGLRSWTAGADGEAVVDALEDRGHVLLVVNIHSLVLALEIEDIRLVERPSRYKITRLT